ncbi:MAG: TetR/AcrR family transcriptional regulator [Alphaproteobacteria bacterium]|nr:TetR/AcrR family transcriptional regulator [Alphaproteobacteria bacterium]
MTDSDDPATIHEPEGRAELRRAAFLKAARDVFLEHGYEAASMAEIVKRAGGSLSTLYAQFGGKKGLFQAMADARVSEFTQQMQVELAAQAPLREGLQRIGERFMMQMAAPESLTVFRLMVGQAKVFPDMAVEYARLGPERVRKALADYLDDRVKAGELCVGDTDLAAAVFFDLVRARIHFRALLDATYRPSDEEIRETVERAVKVFLGGIEAV